MTSEFNKWWDDDRLTQTNPYREDSPVFWAWEGWQAGVKAEREACAKVCDDIDVEYGGEDVVATWCSAAIRARGNT